MKQRYVLRRRAEIDLAGIWRFSAERWGVANADTYYRALIAAMSALVEHPALGRECDDIRPGYRRYRVKAHVNFYRRQNGVIEIVRVLHARRDFNRHLPEE